VTTITSPRVLNKRTDRIPPRAIYCGRPSSFGNPFIIGRDGIRDEVCDKYEAWLPKQAKLMAMIPSLAGRDLVCWCAPRAAIATSCFGSPTRVSCAAHDRRRAGPTVR